MENVAKKCRCNQHGGEKHVKMGGTAKTGDFVVLNLLYCLVPRQNWDVPFVRHLKNRIEPGEPIPKSSRDKALCCTRLENVLCVFCESLTQPGIFIEVY